MPVYHIISEPDVKAKHRATRGTIVLAGGTRLVTTIEAGGPIDALHRVQNDGPLSHRDRRITSIEEIHPGLRYDDRTITHALGTDDSPTGAPLVNPGRTTDDPGAPDLVNDVAYALRVSGLVPGLDVSILANDPDEPYAMVEVFDDALRTYRSIGVEVRDIADDPRATDWEAVLSIARGLIVLSNALH